jgi:O-antigen/teichoic acid export membrane protein
VSRLSKSKTISGIKWTTYSTLLITIFGLVKISVLARYLDSADFGLVALVTFILGFFDLFIDMGLTSAILHKQDISTNEYASLNWLNFFFSCLLFLLVVLSSSLIGFFYNESELELLLPIMGISLLFTAFGRQSKTIQYKYFKFKYIAFVDTISSVISLILGVLLAIFDFGVYALVYSSIVQFAISNFIYFVRSLNERTWILHFNYYETKPFLKIGIYQVGGQVLNYFSRDLDILLVGKFFGSETLGGYSLAKQLVVRPMHVFNPIVSKVASPFLAVVQHEKMELKINFLLLLNAVSTINFLAYGMLAVLAYPVVILVYGKGFSDIYVLVQILSAYMYIRSVTNPVGSLVTATGRTELEFIWNLFVLFVAPILIFICSQYSIEFVALSLLFSSLVLLYPFWRFLIFKLCGVSFREFLISFIPNFYRLYTLIKNNL